MSHEPTILDYIKSRFQKREKIDLGQYFSELSKEEHTEIHKRYSKKKNDLSVIKFKPKKGRLFFISGFVLILIAQILLEPPRGHAGVAIVLYFLAILLFLLDSREIVESNYTHFPIYKIQNIDFSVKKVCFINSIVLLTASFILFKGNRFTILNTSVWICGCLFFLFSVWQKKTCSIEKEEKNQIFYLLFIFIILISAFFRFYLLNRIPGEMFSDHAEKLLDVMDILDGKTPIFFPRNTGREPLQFYLTAFIINSFHTGISFLSLKIGTAVAGFITLIYIFLLGDYLFDKWIGLGAMLFSGIGYWPNVISRVGLRFPFYPLFSAIVLFFLYKGLRERQYDYLLISGIFLGLGLYGYSPIRILPVLVTVIFFIFMILNNTDGDRKFALRGLIFLGMTALVIFLPLFRFICENPTIFNYRAISRLTSIEKPIQGSVFLIFIQNFWNSLTMFFFNNGSIWVNSIPNRPALDVISALFFLVGIVEIFRKIVMKPDWEKLTLLISIPFLLMPSILSLAFPQENPALNRSAGAIIPVFIVCSFGIKTFFMRFLNLSRNFYNKLIVIIIVTGLTLFSIILNYDLVFRQYANQFMQNAWNSSEIGYQIREFVNNGNDPDNAFVVPYPHWVDTRLVGINAGYPRKDYALWEEDLDKTSIISGEKLFIIKPEAQIAVDTLKSLYPDFEEEIFYSKTPGKEFIMIHVQ